MSDPPELIRFMSGPNCPVTMSLFILVYKLNRITRETFGDILELTSKANAERVLFFIEPLAEIPIDFLWERAMLQF